MIPKSFEYEEPKKILEETQTETIEEEPLKKRSFNEEKSNTEVVISNEITEAKDLEKKPSGYPMMNYGHPFMMNQMYAPVSYYPWGYPPQGGYPHPISMYPQFNPMMQSMPYYPQAPAEANFDFLESGVPIHETKVAPPFKNPHLKETSETGDESDDRDEESDSHASESKHRSFGKKRKLNPGSGSVGAKFQTARVVK
jgi:hypothetical protein